MIPEERQKIAEHLFTKIAAIGIKGLKINIWQIPEDTADFWWKCKIMKIVDSVDFSLDALSSHLK